MKCRVLATVSLLVSLAHLDLVAATPVRPAAAGFHVCEQEPSRVAYSPDSKRVAISFGGAAPPRVFELDFEADKPFKEVAMIDVEDGAANHVVFSANGKAAIFTVAAPGGTKIFAKRIEGEAEPKTIATLDEIEVSYLAISSDGKALAASCSDGKARVWVVDENRETDRDYGR